MVHFMVDHEVLVQDFLIENEWDATLLYACLPPQVVEKFYAFRSLIVIQMIN